MSGFLGEYESTLDPKSRFHLPGAVKKHLDEGENTFVITRGTEKCLWLYPLESWKPVYAQISQLNDFDPNVQKFKRYFLGGAAEVELDSAGRMLIPATLKEYAGLQKDIMLSSANNKLEIWDSKDYKAHIASLNASFQETASIVMANYKLPVL